MLLVVMGNAATTDNATHCAARPWSGQQEAVPIQYKLHQSCAYTNMVGVVQLIMPIGALVKQVVIAAPVLALALVRHHAITAVVAALLAVLSFARCLSLAGVRRRALQACLRFANSALTLILATVTWVISSPVQAVEVLAVCGSVVASLLHSHAHVAHSCIHCSLVFVANIIDAVVSPTNVAGVVLSCLIVNTFVAKILQTWWFTITTVQFTVPKLVSRIRQDGFVLGCMGTAQWVRVSRSSQHPRAVNRVRLSNRYAMVKTVKLRISLNASPNAPVSSRVWNSLLSVCLGSEFMANSCTVEYANCFACSSNYSDIEQLFNDLDWTLVDCGSTIHICRDKDKLYNLRPHVTNIRGIVGNATAVSSVIGDRDLVIRDSSGVFRTFTIKNVVYMPNATRDIYTGYASFGKIVVVA